MFTAEDFRAKARQYTERMKISVDRSERRELQQLGQSSAWLANNVDWLTNRWENNLVRDGERASREVGGRAAAAIEEHILRCLGAAVIMRWNTIPTKLQQELFDTAGSMEDLLRTAELRGQIVRFLHNHKDDESTANHDKRLAVI